ncbi:hypothetical protein GCM10022231_28840 [Gordonia caeni]|uniref:Uncharacterized protein n=1 Tax=Gordonia caeni TaxID=1007097 RepID=A0ABP7PIE6_9ACTN
MGGVQVKQRLEIVEVDEDFFEWYPSAPSGSERTDAAVLSNGLSKPGGGYTAAAGGPQQCRIGVPRSVS